MLLTPTPQEQSKGREALEKDHVSPSELGILRQGYLSPPRHGSQGRAMPPSSDSQGLLSLFQGSQPPLCITSPPLTRLSRQDPFVEPMFTWGGGESISPLCQGKMPVSTSHASLGWAHLIDEGSERLSDLPKITQTVWPDTRSQSPGPEISEDRGHGVLEPSFLSRSPAAALATWPGGLALGLSPRRPNIHANLGYL